MITAVIMIIVVFAVVFVNVVIVGGIIPPQDAMMLKQMGVRRVYTPKDFKITPMMGDV